MARRAKAKKREVIPDAKYNSVIVAKLINKIMKWGKKSTAERIVYAALQIAVGEGSKDPVPIVELAVKNATPLIEVKPRRVGGATYQVPVEVSPERGLTLALRWLVREARARSGKSMAEKLSAELSDASQKQGATVKRRENVHKMAEANRAFAHYRW